MAWLRVDDGFTEHPKLIALGGTRDRWTWLELLVYCARRKTRGRVPERIGDVLQRVTPSFLSRCESVGLLDQNGTGYVVHDWATYNPEDPTKAERQARWRAKNKESVDGDVDGLVDGDVDEAVDGPVDAASRARASRTPTPLKTPPPAPSPMGGIEQEDQRRLEAWRTEARKRADVRNPEAWAQTRFVAGGWPHGPEPESVDPLVAATNWIKGYAWDETFTTEMVAEEFDRIAHLAHADELHPRDRDGLLELWHEERKKRYPHPDDSEEKAA
jgi:hypothetical protein